MDRLTADRMRWLQGFALLALAAFGGGCAAAHRGFVDVAAFVTGQAAPDAVVVRAKPRNPLTGTLRLLSNQGPQPSQRTEQLLRRYDLIDEVQADPKHVLIELTRLNQEQPHAELVHAFSELAYIYGLRAQDAGRLEDALNLYSASVAHAYQYLFDERFDRNRNPYDPQFRGACDLYNTALEAALRIVADKGELRPGNVHEIQLGGQTYHVKFVVRGRWHPEDFDHFEFVSDYEVSGLTNHYHTYGLGVPLIAVRKHQSKDAGEQFYPEGLTFPVSALLRVLPAENDQGGPCLCEVELYDPLAATDILIKGRLAPLESDLTTPLAFFLNDPRYRGNALGTYALLRTDKGQDIRGLYMLEPYDPHKIPVVMVHGLWSSPMTWMEMFNDLRSVPEIRDRYQFWFYLYPSGQPFWVSATQMRQDLDLARRELDPERKAERLDQMVLVGHSMGGLVSRMQTLASDDKFWRVLSDKPFQELQASEADRKQLAQMLFFRPNPSIRRVVTIATPHRGSTVSNSATQFLARSLIRLPEMFYQTGHRLASENPGFFRDTQLLTINTSVDSLSPKSPILPVMLSARRGSWVKYHNIVGLISEEEAGYLGRLAGKGDGVVGFASAHLDDVESEIVVDAEHSDAHRHPRAILEVYRILKLHAREMDQAGQPAVRSLEPYRPRESHPPLRRPESREDRTARTREAEQAQILPAQALDPDIEPTEQSASPAVRASSDQPPRTTHDPSVRPASVNPSTADLKLPLILPPAPHPDRESPVETPLSPPPPSLDRTPEPVENPAEATSSRRRLLGFSVASPPPAVPEAEPEVVDSPLAPPKLLPGAGPVETSSRRSFLISDELLTPPPADALPK